MVWKVRVHGSLILHLAAGRPAPVSTRECFTVNTVWRVTPGPQPGTASACINLKVRRNATGSGQHHPQHHSWCRPPLACASRALSPPPADTRLRPAPIISPLRRHPHTRLVPHLARRLLLLLPPQVHFLRRPLVAGIISATSFRESAAFFTTFMAHIDSHLQVAVNSGERERSSAVLLSLGGREGDIERGEADSDPGGHGGQMPSRSCVTLPCFTCLTGHAHARQRAAAVAAAACAAE